MTFFFSLAYAFFYSAENPPGPGPARDRATDSANKGRGEGRKGRKEEGKERACGAERSGPAARMDGWIMDRGESNRLSRGRERREGTEGSRQNQKRERNERVAWTAVVAVCFIDCTSHHMVKDNMRSSRKLCQAVDGARKDGM